MKINPDDGGVPTRSDVFARATMATVLIVAAIAALAITSLIHSHERATARDRIPERTAPKIHAVPAHDSQGSGDAGSFAFGHVEFDWDPAAPGGVPGFDVWPPNGRR